MSRVSSTESNMKIVALVVAAGRGARMGGEIPKQYQNLADTPVLRRTLENLIKIPVISNVCVVIHPDDMDLYTTAAEGLPILPPVIGGAERQDSVLAGLTAISAQNAPDYVLIHDAARPLVVADVVHRIIEALNDGASGAIPALPVADTLKAVSPDKTITHTVDRTHLWRAQTPQGFVFADIYQAHTAATQTVTDDISLLEKSGYSVKIVQGDARLSKLTEPADFQDLERYLRPQSMDIRTGFGLDVHRFEPGNAVILAGVSIPFHKTLRGHSDADVALHALTDALLGSISAGDIGDHFPPSEPKWRGVESAVFLKHAADLIHETGGYITQVDLTIICEAPKIGPHRHAMRNTIAQILNIDVDRVSVKATTTERLGFTGREEGIAAQAIATVSLPQHSKLQESDLC